MLRVPMVIMLVVTLVALTLTIVSKTQLVVGGTSANVAVLPKVNLDFFIKANKVV